MEEWGIPLGNCSGVELAKLAVVLSCYKQTAEPFYQWPISTSHNRVTNIVTRPSRRMHSAELAVVSFSWARCRLGLPMAAHLLDEHPGPD